VQISLLPISDLHVDFIKKYVIPALDKENIRYELDAENKTIGNKIRQSTLQKVPYMIIIGEKEIEKSNIKDQKSKIEDILVSVRTREGKDLGQVNLYEFINTLKDHIEKYE
jgi:threonyl-tRNA synthetase